MFSNTGSIMPLSEMDMNKLSTLISPHVDQVTCIECCKYYMVPSTASCGHTLCHGCWIGRKNCATCGAAVSRKSLKLNLQLQKLTEHTQGLKNEFEKLFKVNLDEFLLDTPIEKESGKDPAQNVKEWLANSENQFSAPEASQKSTQDLTNQLKEIRSIVQIHKETSRTNSTKNIIHLEIPQDDWDKIEEMPDTEELHKKNKENAVGPMDIEPFVVDQFDFTAHNPRRSSRKKNVKGNMSINTDIDSCDQNSTKNTTKDFKVLKHNWANVKKMKKEFNKLNKKSKNKLNVSIEMCKKSLIHANKNMPIKSLNNTEDVLLNTDGKTHSVNNFKHCVESTRNVEIERLSNDNLFKNTIDTEMQIDNVCETEINQNKHKLNNTNIRTKNISDNTQIQPPNANQVLSVPFIMKGALQTISVEDNLDCCDNNKQTILVNTDNIEHTKNTEDIEITIKIGSTVTNICIKKKDNDVKFKINADREVQTSLEKYVRNNQNDVSCSPIRSEDPENNVIISVKSNEQNTSQHVEKLLSNDKIPSGIKTSSNKKNTDSADTATVQYEITESIEKELSKEMEKADIANTQHSLKINEKTDTNILNTDNAVLDDDCLNNLDLFDDDSVKEGNIQSLKSSNHAPSEILISSMKSNRSKKQTDKRVRDSVSDDCPNSKKMKIIHETKERADVTNSMTAVQSKNYDQDGELTNYDFIMGKVFANIDLDLGKKADEGKVENTQSHEKKDTNVVSLLHSKATPSFCKSIHGQSENVFSLLEKENDVFEPRSGKTQAPTENPEANQADLIDQELCTPLQDIIDHSDESIVEETPQKNTSFHKVKQKSGESSNVDNAVKPKILELKRTSAVNAENKSLNSPNMSVINLSDITDDTTRKTKHVTVLEALKFKPSLETPLTITNFVEQIKHKSTPMAKKSLNFDNENTENSYMDPVQTLCPNSILVAKTTQEREFMCKAFEESLQSRAKSPLTMTNSRLTSTKYCIAGSCLTPSELSNVKLLCSLRKWDYVDKYTKDLTHLVVGVDEENKSQRSVKYMCALAASKWIVSYEWVQKCLQVKKVVDEEPYEALDNTGEPGPQRSRLAKQKLFRGITFFCMPPFSVLDVDTLKGMLEAAGGRVVNEAKAVRVTSDSVALLLAEPEHTQENRFVYLAMELSIVPVNSEWVLNCLGSYTISSVQELLLCPESLLPRITAQWPPELLAKDFD